MYIVLGFVTALVMYVLGFRKGVEQTLNQVKTELVRKV